MLTVAKIQPPMFAQQGIIRAIEAGTAQYLINLLLHKDSKDLLFANNCEKLEVICAAFTGNHPHSPNYLEISLPMAGWPPVESAPGNVVCERCLTVCGYTSYGNFLLGKCEACKEQPWEEWGLSDPYYVEEVARFFLHGVRSIERMATSAIVKLDKQLKL